MTVTRAHYDGGWSTDGIFCYVAPTAMWVTGSGRDDPDAVWNATWQQSTWEDHAGAFLVAPFWSIYPAFPDKQLGSNIKLIEISVEDHVTLPIIPTDQYDGVRLPV